MARQQAAVLIESIQQWQDRRSSLVSRYMKIIDTFKGSKDTGSFKSSKKGYDDEYKKCSEQMSAKMKELQSGDPEAAAKVRVTRPLDHIREDHWAWGGGEMGHIEQC